LLYRLSYRTIPETQSLVSGSLSSFCASGLQI
jgi:hypothetical protein